MQRKIVLVPAVALLGGATLARGLGLSGSGYRFGNRGT